MRYRAERSKTSSERSRTVKLSDIQRACMIEATIEPLRSFRRGFARTGQGPFFNIRTVHPLIEAGYLRAYYPQRGKRGLQVSARSA